MSKEINNNVEEPYCSYEISQLLREKGFNCRTSVFYNYKKQLSRYFNPDIDWNDVSTQGLLNSKITLPNIVCAPTHALAIEWIKINFNLNIWVDCNKEGLWIWTINFINDGDYMQSDDWLLELEDLPDNFRTSQEAIEAALLHTLKNLI